jgi:hypothetical protein
LRLQSLSILSRDLSMFVLCRRLRSRTVRPNLVVPCHPANGKSSCAPNHRHLERGYHKRSLINSIISAFVILLSASIPLS